MSERAVNVNFESCRRFFIYFLFKSGVWLGYFDSLLCSFRMFGGWSWISNSCFFFFCPILLHFCCFQIYYFIMWMVIQGWKTFSLHLLAHAFTLMPNMLILVLLNEKIFIKYIFFDVRQFSEKTKAGIRKFQWSYKGFSLDSCYCNDANTFERSSSKM